MSSLRVLCVAVLVGMGGVAAGLAGPGSSTDGPSSSNDPVRGAAISASAVSFDVRTENARAGTPGWTIGAATGRRAGLAAYAGAVSVAPGARVPLVVSGTGTVRIRAFRIGWYDGVGARQVWSGTLEARPQTGRPATWPAVGWADTTGWPPGDYLLRLDAGAGATAVSRYLPLTVRSTSAVGKVLLLTASLTWQAENTWPSGGPSSRSSAWSDSRADSRPGSASGSVAVSSSRARSVSFDRPYAQGYGAGGFLTGDLAVVQQAERTGRPLAYFSDYDVARRPSLVSGAAAVVTGNSQYWTVSLRTALSRALAAGSNLAFFGGRVGDRSVSLEIGGSTAFAGPATPRTLSVAAAPPSSSSSAGGPAAVLRVTGLRSSCPLAVAVSTIASGWTVSDAAWWGYRGTGVRDGQSIPGLLGAGTDRAVTSAVGSPAGLQVLSFGRPGCGSTGATGPATSTTAGLTAGSSAGSRSAAQSAVYWVAGSGAGVFAAGTARWPCAAADTCLTATGRPATTSAATRTFANQVLRTIVISFATPEAGKSHPARSSARQYRALR